MPYPELQRMAQALLDRRQNPWGFWHYFRHQRWLRLLLVLGLVVGMAYLLYLRGHETIAIIIVSVFAGRLLRDMQWFRALARDWHHTDEFIDWSKVERIAAGEEAEPPGPPLPFLNPCAQFSL